MRQRERDKNRSCVRVHTCKVESRELVSPFRFFFFVSGFWSIRFVSVRFGCSYPDFSFLFVYLFFGEGGKGRQWSGGVILPFLTFHSFTTKVPTCTCRVPTVGMLHVVLVGRCYRTAYSPSPLLRRMKGNQITRYIHILESQAEQQGIEMNTSKRISKLEGRKRKLFIQ